MKPILQIKDLQIGIKNRKETIYPVKKVSFEIARGETLSLVGESGSGKSMTALCVMGLLTSWNSYLKPEISGTIDFIGKQEKQYRLNEMND